MPKTKSTVELKVKILATGGDGDEPMGEFKVWSTIRDLQDTLIVYGAPREEVEKTMYALMVYSLLAMAGGGELPKGGELSLEVEKSGENKK